jgi:phosphoribosylglycinamide formyltransferase-1
MDEGPIVAQAAVPVLAGDTAESLGARVLETEHRLYPHALALVASGAVSVQGERVIDTNDQAQVPLFRAGSLSNVVVQYLDPNH